VKLVYIRLNYTTGENITETIHQISEKEKKERKKIIQNTRNIPHLCLNAMVAKKYCEKFWDRWLEGVGEKTLDTRDHRTLEAITFAPT
jgi:cell division protein FtsI/penicillin-binding protein 2